MIRINLLGLKKEVKKSTITAAPSLEGMKLIVFGAVFTVAALGIVYYRYNSLIKESDQLTADLDKASKESKRLAGVKTAVQQLEGVKTQLLRQIDVIEGLQRGRTGPVDMLVALANTVVGTKTMWLTAFDNSGSKISIKGEATSMNTVADFMHNLRATGRFTNIEMANTAQDAATKDLVTFSFDITADIVTTAAPQAGATGRGH